ncbi:hypothetical protein [Streptomyces otsuchiensis]|uniref:hypothetical protein n=1 Tax=Streptomyces otsuchiensis TaxID=2681388 RepID=UPI00102F5EA1|nr:hypothetical protein [Streptomyces otsuchiensis]
MKRHLVLTAVATAAVALLLSSCSPGGESPGDAGDRPEIEVPAIEVPADLETVFEELEDDDSAPPAALLADHERFLLALDEAVVAGEPGPALEFHTTADGYEWATSHVEFRQEEGYRYGGTIRHYKRYAVVFFSDDEKAFVHHCVDYAKAHAVDLGTGEERPFDAEPRQYTATMKLNDDGVWQVDRFDGASVAASSGYCS